MHGFKPARSGVATASRAHAVNRVWSGRRALLIRGGLKTAQQGRWFGQACPTCLAAIRAGKTTLGVDGTLSCIECGHTAISRESNFTRGSPDVPVPSLPLNHLSAGDRVCPYRLFSVSGFNGFFAGSIPDPQDNPPCSPRAMLFRSGD